MKRWVRLAWLLVSGAWLIWVQSIPVMQRAELRRLLDPPLPGSGLLIVVMHEWRQNLFFFASSAVLLAGFLLELLGKESAKYLNVGFYVLYLLIWLPSLVALFFGGVEPEGVPYVVAFGGSALVILTVNYLLYRPWKRRLVRPV
jgi:hypothetical protein